MAQQPEALFVQHPTEGWGLAIKPPSSGTDPDLTVYEKMILALRAQVERLQAELYQATNPPFTGKLDSWQAACGKARTERDEALTQLTRLQAGQGQVVAYKDSTPDLHVGDSSFEAWFSDGTWKGKGTKQLMRDAYAAGMGDPLVTRSSPPAVAQAGVADERAQIEKIARAHGTGGWQTLDDMVRFGLAVRAALAAQPQRVAAVPAMVPLTDEQISEVYALVERDRKDQRAWPFIRATVEEFCRINGLTVGITPGDGGA